MYPEPWLAPVYPWPISQMRTCLIENVWQDIYFVCMHRPDPRHWWESSWLSVCWPPASCRGWRHIAPLHVGSSATAGEAPSIHFGGAGRYQSFKCSIFFLCFQVCSGLNIRLRGSCALWLGNRCPKQIGETGETTDVAGGNAFLNNACRESHEFQPPICLPYSQSPHKHCFTVQTKTCFI